MSNRPLDDYLAIHALYGVYNWTLDTRDTEGMLALFLPEGSITQPGAEGPDVADTPDAVRRVIEGWHADPVQHGRQHQITNLVVTPDPGGDPDRRVARTYFIVTDGDGAPPSTLVWSAFSDDVVVRTKDGWRFLSRRVGVWSAEAADEFAVSSAREHA